MRSPLKCFVVGLFVIAATIVTSPGTASAADAYCVGVLAPGTYQNVIVPQGGSCETGPGPILVRGDVRVLEDATFTSSVYTSDPPSQLVVRGSVHGHPQSVIFIEGQTIQHDVRSHKGALTLSEVTIGGNVESLKGTRAAVFFSPLARGSIRIEDLSGPDAEAQVQGNVLERGDIEVKGSVMSLLCPSNPWCMDIESNFVSRGSMRVYDNVIPLDTEMWVVANTVGRHIDVLKNIGPGNKLVTENMVGGHLRCRRNDDPFTGDPNYWVSAPPNDKNDDDPSDHHNQCGDLEEPPPPPPPEE